MNDLKGTPLKVYSIFRNCADVIQKNKILDTNKVAFKHKIGFEKSTKMYKQKCVKIFNEIENGFYSYKDLTNAIYYLYYNKKRVSVFNVDTEIINTIKEKLSSTQYKKDQHLILQVDKNLKFRSIESYFKINDNGENLAYELVIKGSISPIFYIRIFKKISKKENKKESEKFIRFEKISEILRNK